MGKTLVMKFGGTSVGSVDALRQVVAIVQKARASAAWEKLVVVVSAMNRVTDMLLDSAQAAAEGADTQASQRVAEMRHRHLAVLSALAPGAVEARASISGCLDEFTALCQAIRARGETTPRALDAVASLGERMSAPLVAAALVWAGVPACAIDAAQVIVTDASFQAAMPDMAATQARAASRLGPLLDAGQVPVVTGFIGATSDGVVTTLGRGGSDFSGAVLGAALAAEDVWILTDVDGVMTADPRLVPEAQTLPELTFREMSDLAVYGAKVLNPKTIRPVMERGISLRVKNTFNPEHPGTRIVPDSGLGGGSQLRAVTALKGQQLITVDGGSRTRVPEMAVRTFRAVTRTGATMTALLKASSQQRLSFVVPCASGPEVVWALGGEFRRELGRRDFARIVTQRDCAVVAAVGVGLSHNPRIAGSIRAELGNVGVKIIAVVQDASEANASLVLLVDEADEAVRAIHGLIAKPAVAWRRSDLNGIKEPVRC